MFEKAVRKKLRFATAKGMLSVEDLWDLPLICKPGGTCLDDIAIALDKKLKNSDKVSFVNKDTNPTETNDSLMFDIVKHIIETKLAEQEAQKSAAALAQQRQVLYDALAKQETKELETKSPDEIRKMIAALK